MSPPIDASSIRQTGGVAAFDRQRTRQRLAIADGLSGRARGDVLEEVIAEAFAAIPGLELVSRATRNVSKSQEIDLAFRNRRHPGGLEFFGTEILVECKNWSDPVGSPEIAWYATKLRRADVETGILVATSGVTGDPNLPTGAFAELRDARAEKLTIVVLEREELESVGSGEELAHLLEDKRFAMRTHSKYQRASVALRAPDLAVPDDKPTPRSRRQPPEIAASAKPPQAQERDVAEIVGDAQRLFVLGELHRHNGNAEHVDRCLRDLAVLIQEEHIAADVLLSVGDLSYAGSDLDLRVSWDLLNRLAGALGAAVVVSTVGNHDRPRHPLPVRPAVLADLQPPFPISTSHDATAHYLGLGFAIFDSSPLRVVTIDTASPSENDRPILLSGTRSVLPRRLDEDGARPTNVLVSHYPIDGCEGGPDLARTLDSGVYGPWLHVHGSVHSSSVSNAQGLPDTVVLGMGPLTRERSLPSQQARVSVMHVELPTSRIDLGIALPGRFRSWSWHYGAGWQPPTQPVLAVGGFGFRGSLIGLAEKIGSTIRSTTSQSVSWTELVEVRPELAFLAPEDLLRVVELLRTRVDVWVATSEDEPFLLSTRR